MDNTRSIIRRITSVAIFGALSIILYMVPGLQFSIIPGLSFLKLHFDEIPCLIASLAYGPLTGTCLIIFKGAFKLIQDIGQTGGIGVLADIIYGLSLILPASLIYKYFKTFKGATIAILVGFIVNIIVSSFLGYYIIYPLYGFYLFEATSYKEALNSVYEAFFKSHDDSLSGPFDIKICYEFLLPFNLIKDAIIISVTFIVYKPLSKFLK